MKKGLVIVLAFIFSMNYSHAQITALKKDTSVNNTSNPLFGLRQADFKDLDPSKPLMLDGISTPVYLENLSLVQGEDFMKVMSSGDYFPKVYIDSNNEVKAFVLRKATELEKSKMIKMDHSMISDNDLIGKKAFPFSETDINGNEYSLESLKGKVIVINFWFVECKPCVMEMPDLNNLVEKYMNEAVVFLGFAISDKKKIEKFLKSTTYNYHIIPNAQDAVNAYGVNSFPTHIVIDKNSTISFSANGLGPTTIDDLDKNIKSLLD